MIANSKLLCLTRDRRVDENQITASPHSTSGTSIVVI